MSTGAMLHPFFNGVGTGVTSSALPNQVLPDSKKKEDFKRKTMDALESIGLTQRAENADFRDFYKMVEGKLVYSDYGLDEGILKQIRDIGDEVAIPTFVKHYDFIGIITNQLVGEYLSQRDDFKIDSIDSISENEFIRERTERVRQFAAKTFDLELKRLLAMRGVDPTKGDFQSQEEQQQFLQFIEQQKNELIDPSQIELDMQKNWKTKAAEWAEHVIEADQERFYMDTLDENEMKDYLLTGRFFRHYYVGYDYYKPERWEPLEVFFSQDADAKYPQDGEYVGRVFNLSPSEIIKRYGHMLKPSEIKDLSGYYEGANRHENDNISFKSILSKNFGEQHVAPFFNYYDYELGLQYQDAFGTPMGHTYGTDDEGEEVKIPTWLGTRFNQNFRGYSHSVNKRDDINVRIDSLQVTEGYWRSWKRMWFLNYTTLDGVPDSTIVTDELLQDFIRDNDIKKVTSKSIEDIKGSLEPNTMYEFWIPEIWKGIKINNGNSYLKDSIYLGVEPLEYQIKGDSNVFDVKLPVGGIIGNSMAAKLRPFQVGYNICLNQIFNLLEKEIGTFFLFDINFLPSEYKEMGNSEQALLKLRELAQSVGIVPMDTKKQNLEGANPQMNVFQTQSITYDVQIQSRINLANAYKSMALEQIGITPQRLGSPGKYETAAGVEQGTKASYTQTEHIFSQMSVARRKTMELHLAVAQYCQKEYLDVDMVFTKSDGDKQYMNLTDKDFPLRRLGLLPINNSKKRRDLDNLRNTLLQTNTLGNDMLDYAQLFSADSVTSLVAIGRKNRLEKQREVESQRQHEQSLLDKQLQANAEQKQFDREWEENSKERDRQSKIQTARITAAGRAIDRDATAEGIASLEKISNMAINQEESQANTELANRKLDNESREIDIDREVNMQKLNMQLQEFQQKERKMNNDRYIASINKN